MLICRGYSTKVPLGAWRHTQLWNAFFLTCTFAKEFANQEKWTWWVVCNSGTYEAKTGQSRVLGQSELYRKTLSQKGWVEAREMGLWSEIPHKHVHLDSTSQNPHRNTPPVSVCNHSMRTEKWEAEEGDSPEACGPCTAENLETLSPSRKWCLTPELIVVTHQCLYSYTHK